MCPECRQRNVFQGAIQLKKLGETIANRCGAPFLEHGAVVQLGSVLRLLTTGVSELSDLRACSFDLAVAMLRLHIALRLSCQPDLASSRSGSSLRMENNDNCRFPEETAQRAAASADRHAGIQRKIKEEQREQRRRARPDVSLMPWGYGVASSAHVGS